MKIKFTKKYTDQEGKEFKKGSVWGIHDPAARKLIADGYAEAYQEPVEVELVSRPSKIVDAKGNRLEVVQEQVKGPDLDEDGNEIRPRGKDT